MRIPFSVYDFFAYLSSGLVVGAAADLVVGEGWVLQADQPLMVLVLMVVGAYVLGHFVAQLSALCFESGFVSLILLRPSVNLLAETPSALRFLFPGYFTRLPKHMRERIVERADGSGVTPRGEDLFLHAYGVVTRDKLQQERLDAFRNLYGFARNMSCSFLVVAIILLVGGGADIPGWVPAAAGIVAIGMFYRYLKFFRLYTYQLLTVYASSED